MPKQGCKQTVLRCEDIFEGTTERERYVAEKIRHRNVFIEKSRPFTYLETKCNLLRQRAFLCNNSFVLRR